MTAQQTQRVDPAPARSGSTKSSDKAYQRRIRREQALAGGRLTRTGSPISAALSRVPYVAAIILLLAGGIVGVLWLNTMSDAAGLRATHSRINQMDLTTQIEAADKQISGLQDPARLAAEAANLGLVVPGDVGLLQVGSDGKGTVIGTPTPAPGPAVPATATTAPPAPAGPGVKTTAANTTAANTTAAKTTAVKTTAAKTTAAKTTAAKTTAAKTTAAKTTAAKKTAKTTPAKATVSPPKSQQAPASTGGRP